MRARLTLASMALFAASACNFSQAGIDPDPGVMNFPIAIEVHQPDPDAAASHLFVVNSNFDVRYNSGSLQAYDLAEVERLIRTCPELGDECTFEDVRFLGDPNPGGQPLLFDEVGIGSHGDGIALRPGDQGRIYLPIRAGRGGLTTVDFVQETGFECGQTFRDEDVPDGTPPWDADDIPRCADERRVSRTDNIASERGLELPPDPVDIATIPSSAISDVDVGDFVLMALRSGQVALLLDDGSGATPELIYVIDGFPENIVTLTMDPSTGIGWMMAAGTDELARVGIVVDTGAPTRSFLYDAGSLRLGAVDDGEDTRDIAFHPDEPSVAYILSRRPDSVVEVDVDRRGLTSADIGLRDVFEVGAGPSRLTLYQADERLPDGTLTGEQRTFILASCFSAQRLFVIDANHGALVSVVGGFSGPFEMAVDAVSNRLYLVDFSLSVIRVLDLSPLGSGGSPTLMATIGDPRPVQSLTGN